MAMTWALWFGLLLCGAPATVFCVQVFTAWYRSDFEPSNKDESVAFDAFPVTVILVPAHNEEKVISQTLIQAAP